MKKGNRVPAWVLLVVLLLSGCGSKIAAGIKPSPSPEPTPRPDRAGFDRDTNQTVTIGELSFGLPAYYEEKDTGTNTEKVFRSTDLLSEALICCGVQSGSITDQMFVENKEDVMDQCFPKMERTSEVTVISVAGLNGLSAGFRSKIEKQWYDCWCVVANDPECCLYQWLLIVSPNAPYDYAEDFNKTLDSVRRIEKRAEPTAEPKSETSSDTVDPDLKAMLDEYEAFVDEYVKFMKSYRAGSASMNDMMKYLNFLSKYADFAERADAVDEKKLSNADYLYYSQVMLRISQKLLEAAG